MKNQICFIYAWQEEVQVEEFIRKNLDHNSDIASVSLNIIGKQNENNIPIVFNKYSIISDQTIISSDILKYQLTSLPAFICCDNDNYQIEYLQPDAVNKILDDEMISNLVEEAIEAYNIFDLHVAVQRFQQVLQLKPTHKEVLFNLASIMHMWELPTLAVGYIVQLLLIDSSDSIAHSFLWALYLTGLCNTATLNAYHILANNNDIRAKTKLATITGSGLEAVSGNPAYVEQLYDEMATKFETKLVDFLQYRGPWVMYEYLEELLYGTSSCGTSSNSGSSTIMNSDSSTVKYCSNDTNTNNSSSTTSTAIGVSGSNALNLPEKGSWRILDIGCGSGLVGKVFESYIRHCDTHGNKSNTNDNTTTTIAPSSTTMTTNIADSITTTATTTAIIENINDNSTIKISNLKEIITSSGGLMIGIDVSAKIAEIARNTGKYNYVLHSDLTTALKCLDYRTNLSQDMGSSSTTTSAQDKGALGLDMVIAADTFIYVGALGEVFSLVRDALCDECTPNTSSSATTTATTGSVCDNTTSNSSNNTTASTLPPPPTTLHTTQVSVSSTCECSAYKKGGLFMFTTEDLDLSPMRIHHTTTTGTSKCAPDTCGPDSTTSLSSAISVPDPSGPDNTGTIVTGPNRSTYINNCHTNTQNVLNLEDRDLDITGAVPGWGGQLLTSARFAHSNRYIDMLADKYNFDIIGRKSIILRTEETVPLPGNLFILQKITNTCKCNK